MKILVISLAGIGDTLMATPLIHELRANFPQATIDVLSMWPASRGLLAGNPHINELFQKNLLKSPKGESWEFLNKLRERHYDISINTHPQSRVHYRIVARLIGARCRISHEYDQSNLFDRILVNKTIKQDYAIHCVENNLALLALCGARRLLPQHDYEVFLAPPEHEWADSFLREKIKPGNKCIGFHVGSGGTKNLALRRWPIENYISLISEISHSRPDISILLFGGPEEEKDHARILAETGSDKVLIPHTKDIRQAAALIKRCDLFLSVDTALMHVAAAMKVPHQLVIETPTFNKTVEPYNNPFTLIKNPDVAGKNLDFYRYDGAGIRGEPEELIRCMKSVSVGQVQQAINEALG